MAAQSPPLLCIMTHCMSEASTCYLDKECREVLNCFSTCDPSDTGCAFSCGGSPLFTDLLVCMIQGGCMEAYPESGVCLATDQMALQIEDYQLISGSWWTVYGQSCGQSDSLGYWTGAYDWVPCAHHRIVTTDGVNWINNTTFCPGTDSVCEGDLIVTSPAVFWTSPGVLRHQYGQEDAPLVPQIEDRKFMWLSGDWAIVVWCGYNPVQKFNGAFVMSRHRSDGTIPGDLVDKVRDQLDKLGISLDNMCLTDSTQCEA